MRGVLTPKLKTLKIQQNSKAFLQIFEYFESSKTTIEIIFRGLRPHKKFGKNSKKIND